MRSDREERFAHEETQALLSMLDELGKALRTSFETLSVEALPEEMGLLLLRLALAEALERAAREDACEQGSHTFFVGVEHCTASDAAVAAWAG
jgi:hypothetical protein